MFVIAWALLIPAALAGIPLEPFPLLGAVLFAQLLPAVLVTAAVGGRSAVRELFSRVFRWRVRLLWYVVALFAIPVVALLISVILFGTGAVHALVLLGSEAALTLPDETASDPAVASFYHQHRAVIVALQLVGLVAAGPLAGYAGRLRRFDAVASTAGVTTAALACAPAVVTLVIALVADPCAADYRG